MIRLDVSLIISYYNINNEGGMCHPVRGIKIMSSKKDSVIEAISSYNGKSFSVNDIAMDADMSVPYASNVLKSLVRDSKLASNKAGKKLQYKVTKTFETLKKQVPLKVSVEDRFRFIQNLTDMVIKKDSPSILVTGMPGIGKTHLVTERFNHAGLTEGLDYLLIKGHSSPMGLFSLLHDNREATIVFDDTDAVFKDDISLNILKAALDSYDRRLVSWYSKKVRDAGMDTTFEFRGSIIFISNLDESKIDPAIKSRTFVSNLNLTRVEVIDHMRNLAPKIAPEVSMEIKLEVLSFLLEKADNFKEFNLRTFIKALKIRNGAPKADWKNMAELMA